MIRPKSSPLHWLLIGWCLLVILSGCATQAAKPTPTDEMADNTILRSITGIDDYTDVKGYHLRIQSTGKLLFTAVKQVEPPAVTFYFPNTESHLANPLPTQFTAPMKAIILKPLGENQQTLRMDLILTEDVPYEVNQAGSHLEVTLPNKMRDGKTGLFTKPPLEEGLSDQTVSDQGAKLTAVEVLPQKGLTHVRIGTSQMITDVQNTALNDPARIVVDLYGIADRHLKEQLKQVNLPGVRQVRYFGDGQRLRVVIDTEPQYLEHYTVTARSDGVLIAIKNRPASIAAPVTIRSVDYEVAEDGEALLAIQGDRLIQYRLDRIEPEKLRLRLLNSVFVDQLAPVPVAQFRQGAIAGLSTKQVSSAEAQIDITLKKAVPYLVDQEKGQLYLQFDAALFDAAPVVRAEEAPAPMVATVSNTQTKTSKYNGEKIALNLHDADIRNLFKIIADVSGENFAVDKDVTGRVTLTLDKPVPWDQLLDLVLKMNRLEKRVEEGIIRIATQESLTLEDQSRAERRKVQRALEDQADMVTEYITANYADAEKNIKPHLEVILSKNIDGTPRGTLSVDSRNNVLIITDVPTAIARAKEIVKELDRVTPQVLIEARVVEASSDISQALGISWKMGAGIANDHPSAGIGPQRGFGNIGGTYGYNTAINFPVANAPTIGFNFSRILGSPFLLDMQLSALEEQGTARIISSPRILTLDNQEAIIQQGAEYPYSETAENGGTTTKFKEIDLELKVRPHITPDQRVMMEVSIEKKDIAGFELIGGNRTPILNTKYAKTEFLMNDGDTIVIGGINKTTETVNQSGFPLLSRIPILGWLFKTKTNENNKEEMLIFITPKISRLGQKSVTSSPMGQTVTTF